MGALAEKPEMMGRALVFVGLAEGIGGAGVRCCHSAWVMML